MSDMSSRSFLQVKEFFLTIMRKMNITQPSSQMRKIAVTDSHCEQKLHVY